MKKRKNVLGSLVGRYFSHRVGRSAAALTYYLIFSIWPFVIFISALLGSLDLGRVDMEDFANIVPEEIIEVINSYISYVTENESRALLWFGLVFTIWFAMRAVNCLLESIDTAFGRNRSQGFVVTQLRLLIMTLITIVALAVTLVIIAAGPRVLSAVLQYLPALERVARIWISLRFVLLAALLFLLLTGFYIIAVGRRYRYSVICGTVASLSVWMLISVGFSYYVENIARYSLFYGSLGAVIVLLLWLYLTAALLITGAELCAVIAQRREGRVDAGQRLPR